MIQNESADWLDGDLHILFKKNAHATKSCVRSVQTTVSAIEKEEVEVWVKIWILII